MMTDTMTPSHFSCGLLLLLLLHLHTHTHTHTENSWLADSSNPPTSHRSLLSLDIRKRETHGLHLVELTPEELGWDRRGDKALACQKVYDRPRAKI